MTIEVAEATLERIQKGLKDRLETIDGLRATATVPDIPNLPAAYPMLVSWVYDTEFGGAAQWTFDVFVMVTISGDMNRAQTNLNAYISPTGRKSIKCAIEADPSLGGCGVSFTHVQGGGAYGQDRVGAVDVLSASVRVVVAA